MPGLFRYLLILTVIIIVLLVIKGYTDNKKKRNLPHSTVNARVIDKREHMTRFGHHGDHSYTRSYYVTFEYYDETDKETEFYMSPEMYAALKLNDTGTLQFQGDLFHSFEHSRGIVRWFEK